MPKIQLNLTLTTPSPKRWKLTSEDGAYFGTISYKTKRQFYLTDKWLNKEKNVEEVLEFEAQITKQQFFEYLARSEQSPTKAKDWLKKRAVKSSKIEKLIEEAEEKGFLSSQRYGEIKLKREFRKGNKPLWRIKADLQNQGISSDDVDLSDYNEKESLKNYINKNLWKRNKDPEKFTKSLMTKGFNYGLIKSVLTEIDEEQL